MQGTIEVVDPRDLTIALNVRTDVKLDPEFVASIKELGVLQPPMVTATSDGSGYEVVLGQRRTLAAVEAGLSEIPVYLVDKSEADAARVIDQLTENDQRQQLTEAERVGGYKQLALFGITPAEIAKRTSVKVERVTKALQVADEPTAIAALTEHEITLDQAAVLIEFADDPEAIEALVAAAGSGSFDHVAGEQRKATERRAEKKRLTAYLEGLSGVVRMKAVRNRYDAPSVESARKLEELALEATPTTPAQPEDIIGEEFAAARIVEDWLQVDDAWKQWVTIQWYVLDPDANGFVRLQREATSAELTPEQLAMRERREAEEAERQAKIAAFESAAEVRHAWLVQMLQRPDLPADALEFVASAVLHLDGELFQWEPGALALELLDVPKSEEKASGRWNGDRHPDAVSLVAHLARQPKKEAPRLLFALAIAQCDDLIDSYLREEHAIAAADYLARLAGWGYGLSKTELDFEARAMEIVNAQPDVDEEPDEEPDEEADEEDAVA